MTFYPQLLSTVRLFYYYYYYSYLTAIWLTPGSSSIHLHTNSTQNTEDGTHVTITRKKIRSYKEKINYKEKITINYKEKNNIKGIKKQTLSSPLQRIINGGD
jgi:hypothetical protein